jgi:hypothetical protein
VVAEAILGQIQAFRQPARPRPPRHLFPHSAPILLRTRDALRTHRLTIGAWLVQEFNRIARRRGPESGNLYRLAGAMVGDLYGVTDAGIEATLARGRLPERFSGGDHKRFWMLLMWLRRDAQTIRGLVARHVRSPGRGGGTPLLVRRPILQSTGVRTAGGRGVYSE